MKKKYKIKIIKENKAVDAGAAVLAQAGKDLTDLGVVPVVQFLNSPEGQDPKVRAALKSGLSDGNPGDEKIVIDTADPPVANLKPTQREISLFKSTGFPLSKVESVQNAASGDITGQGKKIVTSGDLVIDGHHRWSSTWAVVGTGSAVTIDAINLSLPGNEPKKKLAGAQLAIAATMDSNAGKLPSASAGEGDNIMGKGKDEIANMIRLSVGKDVKGDPILGDKYLEKIKKTEEGKNYFGLEPNDDNETVKNKIIEVVSSNLANLPSSDGPERIFMPQFDGGETHKKMLDPDDVFKTMSSGRLNFKSPFAVDESVVYDRWKKLIK